MAARNSTARGHGCVFLASHPYDDPAGPTPFLINGRKLDVRGPEHLDAVRAATVETVGRLRADGRQVVIIEGIPAAPTDADPVQCLSKAKFLDECRYVTRVQPTSVERMYRELAEADGVFTMDLDRQVCPYLPICDPVVDGLIVKRDVSHLTGAFSKSLVDDVRSFLLYTGLIKA